MAGKGRKTLALKTTGLVLLIDLVKGVVLVLADNVVLLVACLR